MIRRVGTDREWQAVAIHDRHDFHAFSAPRRPNFLATALRRCERGVEDRKSTRLNSSHSQISYAVFCLKKKKEHHCAQPLPPFDRSEMTLACDDFASLCQCELGESSNVSSIGVDANALTSQPT